MTHHERHRAPLSWPVLCRYRVVSVDFVSCQRYKSHHPMQPGPRWQSPREGGRRWKEDIMAEYGEWNRKGATLSDVTAKAEYGVDRDVIVKGIQTGKLEYREGSVWGNPYLRVLRSQLEQYLAEELGEDYLRRVKHHTELRRVKKAVADLKKQLAGLQKRQQELEASLGT
jgi:hypothetical protein